MVQAPQSPMAESVRELRTSLRVILDETPCPLIVVTSPEPGDGKTFVTANLAAAWAMSGSKVIVVSRRLPSTEARGDLRAGGDGRPGLADLIRANWKKPEIDDRPRVPGRRPKDRSEKAGDRRVPSVQRSSPCGADGEVGAVARPAVGGFAAGGDRDLGPADCFLPGPSWTIPSELFGSPGMQPVLDQLLLLADIVLLDTPAHPVGAGHRHHREHGPQRRGRCLRRPDRSGRPRADRPPPGRPPTATCWGSPSTG